MATPLLPVGVIFVLLGAACDTGPSREEAELAEAMAAVRGHGSAGLDLATVQAALRGGSGSDAAAADLARAMRAAATPEMKAAQRAVLAAQGAPPFTATEQALIARVHALAATIDAAMPSTPDCAAIAKVIHTRVEPAAADLAAFTALRHAPEHTMTIAVELVGSPTQRLTTRLLDLARPCLPDPAFAAAWREVDPFF